MRKAPDRELEQRILEHVKDGFGWHGGMGDYPADDALLAVIRGTLEYLDEHEGATPR